MSRPAAVPGRGGRRAEGRAVRGRHLSPPRKVDVHDSYDPAGEGRSARIEEAVALMASAKRPVIYSGGGVIDAGPEASKLLRDWSRPQAFRSPRH